MVWRRFSAWSNTMLVFEVKTSSVTSRIVMTRFLGAGSFSLSRTGAACTRLTFDRAVMARYGVREPIGVAERFEQLLHDRVEELSRQQSAEHAVRAAIREAYLATLPEACLPQGAAENGDRLAQFRNFSNWRNR